MTLLVGMVGSDGLLLAADKARVRPANNETQMDDKMLGRKITHLEQHEVVYAVTGDELTDALGVALLDALDSGSIEFGGGLERSLIAVVERKMADLRAKGETRLEPIERTAMVVFYGPQAIAGGEGNSARFFQSYYEPNLPIRRLLPLAAHIVLMGHRIDALMVEDLDIATFDSDGFHWFTEEQKAPLRETSKSLDALIGRRLLR